jgi:hypothetical protein
LFSFSSFTVSQPADDPASQERNAPTQQPSNSTTSVSRSKLVKKKRQPTATKQGESDGTQQPVASEPLLFRHCCLPISHAVQSPPFLRSVPLVFATKAPVFPRFRCSSAGPLYGSLLAPPLWTIASATRTISRPSTSSAARWGAATSGTPMPPRPRRASSAARTLPSRSFPRPRCNFSSFPSLLYFYFCYRVLNLFALP